MTQTIQVAAYYFPNFHVDPRNEAVHGRGWTEWELVRRAEPRSAGHRQPREPLWGYEHEDDPDVFARKIGAAADNGIDAFIFDWYWDDGGGFLLHALERGYLQADNNDRLKFALMWANHDWVDIHPAKMNEDPVVLRPGAVTPMTWDILTDYVIETYMRHPCYWRIDGKPYFSIYHVGSLMDGLGGLDATREALQQFRRKVKDALAAELHLNAILWGMPVMPGEGNPHQPAELVEALRFDSVASYVWVHHVELKDFPETDYRWATMQAVQHWADTWRTMPVPYIPNVTVGWDPSPRTVQSDTYENAGYPFSARLAGNTPEAFGNALRKVRAFMDRRPDHPGICTINAWNEWTEGSYLEPDTKYAMAYLEAVREVFGG